MSDPTHTAVAVVERSQVPSRMHPLVQVAMQGTPDPATIREMMVLQREWEAGEAKREYTRALVELKATMPTVIRRDKEVSFGNTYYTHSSLAEVVSQVTQHLAAHGFSLSWEPSTHDKMVTVTAKLTHAGGHQGECSISAPIDNKGSKSEAQGVASTITLLQRYTALSLLGIATADMPEPVGEDAPRDLAKIDTARNLKAAGAITKAGKDVRGVEAMLGRKVPDWTAGDLDRVREWLTEPKHANRPAEEAIEVVAGEVVTDTDLTKALEMIELAQSLGELEAIKPHAAKLGKEAKPHAIAAYKHKHAALSGKDLK